MDGFGAITWWGFSPAIDFQNEDLNQALKKLRLEAVNTNDDEVNILMIGAGDSRHLLKTLARSHRHSHKKLNFYILENNMELYARHLLFLTLALEQPRRMGLQEKTELFLELYGNSLVREQSIGYVEKMADIFITMVTDTDYLEKKMPLVDMSLLKFKERDMLEAIFKFWRNLNRSSFDIAKAWDLRLRQFLGPRYDAIPNVFDWDYSMKLVDRGAGIIHSQHYKQWRQTGVAYEIREGTYDVPNKTLASGMVFKHGGERVARRGFWGDVLVSPYLGFGIESAKTDFFKKSNNAYTTTAQEVAEYNVMEMFHEILHKSKYEPKNEPIPTTGPPKAQLTEITEEEEEENCEEDPEKEEQSTFSTEYEPTDLSFAKVYFLPLNSAGDLYKKSRFQQKFDFIYLSNSMAHLLNENLAATFSDSAAVVMETAKYMLELKPEQIEEFVNKITGIAEGAGCKVVETPDATNCFAEFSFSRKCTSS